MNPTSNPPVFSPIRALKLQHMGSDKAVVDAARVSFAKFSALGFGQGPTDTSDESLITYLATGMRSAFKRTLATRIAACADMDDAESIIQEIREIAEHWTPFGHCAVSFQLRAPIFLHRQITRSGVGLVINEESRRYVDHDPEFWKPAVWRGRATDKKQGSAGALHPNVQAELDALIGNATRSSLIDYRYALKLGAAPEQARIMLSLNTHTEWVWTGSLYAWARVCKLRLAPDAQEETREAAEQISGAMLHLFPLSWKALVPRSWRS